jgi:hypothetical protein
MGGEKQWFFDSAITHGTAQAQSWLLRPGLRCIHKEAQESSCIVNIIYIMISQILGYYTMNRPGTKPAAEAPGLRCM